jgi:cytochrome c biogenesis protein CcmG/thiol:disulfide interchange protein DsbE
MNWKVLVGGLLAVVPLVWILASGFGHDPKGVSNALEGKVAPAFHLTDLDGVQFRLEDARGAPFVLNFWATWCQPCVQEWPEMQQAAAIFGGRGVRFYGVLYNDEPATARAFLQRRGAPFSTLLDPGQRTAIDFGVTGVPETFVIDGAGTIRKKFAGPLSFEALKAELEPLL